MNVTEQARRSDALYFSGNDGINRRWLCDKVVSLEAENAKLRVERDEWHRVAESKQDSIDHMRDARAENAKLRELVRELYEDQCCDGDQWKYRDRMHELGVEVQP